MENQLQGYKDVFQRMQLQRLDNLNWIQVLRISTPCLECLSPWHSAIPSLSSTKYNMN